MTKAHRLKTRKGITRTEGSSPQSRGAREREAMAKQQQKGLILPVNFLLTCSDDTLVSYELARLAEIADVRAELHVLLDRLIDSSGQVSVVRWFRTTDRQALKHAIENEESPIESAQRKIREGQRSDDDLIPLPALEPGAAHLAAAVRYQQRNNAEGKCRYCPKPLDRNSADTCTEHFAKARIRARQKRGLSDPGGREYLYSGELPESTQGRQPGTLQSLALNREKKTRAVLAEMGLPLGSTATALQAAKEELLKHMPHSENDALMAWELFDKAGFPDSLHGTAKKALRELVATDQVQRIGKGVNRNPFLYFAFGDSEKPKRRVTAKSKIEQNKVLLQTLHGEEPER